MSLMNEYPLITANLKIGNGVYATADPYNTLLQNNGAMNPPGSVSCLVSPSQAGTALQTSTGYGSYLWVKYVRYLSTANPATVGGPAPVYYTDETFTTVTGVASEGLGVNFIAGYMLPNTSTGATGAGAGFTNTVLNNSALGSYVFVALAGFVPGVISVASTAVGDAQIGASGNFTVARVAANTAPTNRVLGWAMTAVASGLCDVMCDRVPF